MANEEVGYRHLNAYELDIRWRNKVYDAGYDQPTEAQMVARWNEQPELWEDLCAVLGGYDTVIGVSRQREWARKRRA